MDTGLKLISARHAAVSPMPASPELLALADHKYVSLVTFRKSGEGVPTVVWVARDGDSLLVTTVE